MATFVPTATAPGSCWGGEHRGSHGRRPLRSGSGVPRQEISKAAYIAPAERRLALYEPAAECPGMSRDELIRQTCEFFGRRRTGRDIREFLESDIGELLKQAKLAFVPVAQECCRPRCPS